MLQKVKQYLQQASALKEYDLLASKSRFLIQYYLNQRLTDKAELLADSLLNLQDYFKEPSSLGHLKLKRAAAYYDKNLLSKAIADYQQSAEHFMTSGDSIFAADAFFFGGQALSDVNDFLQAIQNYERAEQLYDLLGDQQYAILVGAELTSLYKKNGFVDKSIQERERLIQKDRANEDNLS